MTIFTCKKLAYYSPYNVMFRDISLLVASGLSAAERIWLMEVGSELRTAFLVMDDLVSNDTFGENRSC